MIFLDLFITFLIVGSISFGGGYAIIPVIEMEVTKQGWMTTQDFMDVIAIAGMSPGPIAVNSAVFVGYQTAGLTGAIVSAAGIIMPSLLMILIIATIYFKIYQNQVVKSAFYGLRPIIVGLIFYAAIRFALADGILSFPFTWEIFGMLSIFIFSLLFLFKFRWHPVYVIMMSGLVGIAFF